MGRQNANQTPALFRSGLVLLLVSINDGDYGDYYYWIDSLSYVEDYPEMDVNFNHRTLEAAVSNY